MKIIIRYRYTT